MLILKYLLKGGRKWYTVFTKPDTPESLELMKQEAKALCNQHGWRAVCIIHNESGFVWEHTI